MEINVEHYVGGCVGTNSYLIENDGKYLLLDAPAGAAAWVVGMGKRVDCILLTHQHFDHVEGVSGVVDAFDCPVLAWAKPSEFLIRQENARSMGLPVQVPEYEVTRLLSDGEELSVVGLNFMISHLPGHSTDSIVAYCEEKGFVVSGDTLMASSMGRTDLPGGDHETLLTGIRDCLYSLGDETAVLPGHGPVTTIGREKTTNPFV